MLDIKSSIFKLLNFGKVIFILPTLLVSNVLLLVLQVYGCILLRTSIVCLSDHFKNIMSPSDPESTRTLQTTLLLDDSGGLISAVRQCRCNCGYTLAFHCHVA